MYSLVGLYHIPAFRLYFRADNRNAWKSAANLDIKSLLQNNQEKKIHFQKEVIPFPSGRTVSHQWHCIATAVGELCYRSDTALLPQRENFATAVAMQCYCGGGRTEFVTSFTGLLPIGKSLLYEFEELSPTLYMYKQRGYARFGHILFVCFIAER